MEPEHTKYIACRASPCRRRYSPGAQKEVLICRDRDLRQPRLAHSKRESCKISLFKCMVMSERSSSGKSFKSCQKKKKREKEWKREKMQNNLFFSLQDLSNLVLLHVILRQRSSFHIFHILFDKIHALCLNKLLHRQTLINSWKNMNKNMALWKKSLHKMHNLHTKAQFNLVWLHLVF